MKYFSLLLLFLAACFSQPKSGADRSPRPVSAKKPIITGADQLDKLLPLIRGKQIALVVNQTSRVNGVFLVDTLRALSGDVFEKRIEIRKIFAVEHGIRGDQDAGATISSGKDEKTGIPIESLYGEKKKPSEYDLKDVEIVVFDIQDVGVRFYTYLSTLFYVMEGCAENRRQLIILDRPNPNGHYIDGPTLEKGFDSFVGIVPVPIVHGCTVGEMAQLINGQEWLRRDKHCKLTVIPCLNYSHAMLYEPPVRPSPNLPNMRSILLYPSLCLFEGTSVSVGRGTEKQFQVFGHPFGEGEFCFTPQPNLGAKDPLHNGKKCCGEDLTSLNIHELWKKRQLDLSYLLEMKKQLDGRSKFFNDTDFFEKLAGTASLRKQILAGKTEAEIRETWQPGLAAFKILREPYLLYPDF